MNSAPFSLLGMLYRDEPTHEIFTAAGSVNGWLAFERALARAQGHLGIISATDAEVIAAVCEAARIDTADLWEQARNVGYPILPLVRQLAAQLPEGPSGRVHYGATTQDAMDTGLALQLAAAIDRLTALTVEVGDRLADVVSIHRSTVMAGRTHAQQAVPTTLGVKLASLLAEYGRHRDRLSAVRGRACVLSAFGAAGTSAAYGPHIAQLREVMAADLGLGTTGVSWHTSRDSLAEVAFVASALAQTCAKFAREVIALSRTEIGELSEAAGHHRGASSTMPQKANPILCEGIVGLAVSATSMLPAQLRAMESEHERAAGEWQIEWEVLPRILCLSAAAMSTTAELLDGLQVDSGRMAANMTADGGGLMAESYMIALAPDLGREKAHDVVYAAVLEARRTATPLAELMTQRLGDAGALDPTDYLGDYDAIVNSALADWTERASAPTTAAHTTTQVVTHQ